MHEDIIEVLICPTCEAQELCLRAFVSEEPHIEEGTLTCLSCRTWFRIENGVLDFLPLSLRRRDLYAAFAEKYRLPNEYTMVQAGGSQKANQIDFYKGADAYEKQVVESPFYRALDQVAFFDWLDRNQERIKGMVLDIGCGTGRQCIPLAKRGFRTIGIDISEEMLIRAKRKAKAARVFSLIDLIVGDGESPAVRESRFGAGVMYGVLHHLPAPDLAIKNTSRKLAAGALFYSLDPHRSPLRFVFDLLMRLWKLYDEEARDEPLLTTTQLNHWLSEAGLNCTVKLSTYLPAHLFQFMDLHLGTTVLRTSDRMFNAIPGVRKVAGVIIAEGVKTA